MLKKALFLLIFIFVSEFSFSQKKETCDGPKEDVTLDLSSITKCSVNNSKDETSDLTARNSKRVTIQVSSRRRRVVRRRSTATSVNSISSNNKLEKIKSSNSLVGKLNLASKNISDKLPFNFVEEKPIFSSCRKSSIKEQGPCFKEELNKHIRKNFKYPVNSFKKGIQGRVLIQFVINEFGEIEDLITRGPVQGEELEKEAKRIINKLPKLIPGKMNGTPIKVKYGIPIAFKIPGRKATNIRRKATNNVILENIVNFSKVQNIPLFKSCKNKVSDNERLDCFNSQLSKHVQKYFAYPEEATRKNIQGRVFAYFVIDKEGDVVNIKTRTPKNGEILGKATKQIVSKLPKFIPGKENGKNVNVQYAFPINFKLNQ